MTIQDSTKDSAQKRCSTCKTLRPLHLYNNNRSQRDGHHHQCKWCHRFGVRKAYLRRTYGITGDEYQNLSIKQGGRCAICGQSVGKGRVLDVDHCHVTGKIRGLLCNPCNSGLATLGDNLDGLMRAVNYLQRALDPPGL